mgnify:CR=1 FL=1
MEEFENLEQLTKNIAVNLLDAKYLINTLTRIVDGDAEQTTILDIILLKIEQSFKYNEKCRSYISKN